MRVPSWRRDVEGGADLVEEIARIHGYDKVPSTPLERAPGVARPTATRSQIVERRVRRTAASRGLDEAVTWSFISEAEAEPFGPAWRVTNPISEEMKVMRPSLLPGLVAAARRNVDRGASSVRLFEVGRRYLADAEQPTVTVLLAGDKRPRDWKAGKAQGFDAFDAKAEVLAILEAAGAPVPNLQLFPDAGPTWHPGRSARLGLGPKTIVASFGELHPALARALDAPAGSVAGEIYLDAIPAPRSSDRARALFAPTALQPVSRDFAFLVPDRRGRRAAGPRDPRRRQASDYLGAAVRPVRDRRRAVAGGGSDAAAGREELHRRGDRRDLQADRRRRRKARREAARLIRAR